MGKNRSYTGRELANMFFCYKDGMSAHKIAKHLNVNQFSVSPTVHRMEKDLINPSKNLSRATKKALIIIRENLGVRDRKGEISKIKQKLASDLEKVLDNLVEDAINERHSELLQETIDLKRENKKLLLKLENKRVMEDAYETGQV